MNELQQKIVGAVDAANGSIAWNDLMSNLDYREQQRALGEIRGLEVQKVLKRNVARNPDTGEVVFTVNKL